MRVYRSLGDYQNNIKNRPVFNEMSRKHYQQASYITNNIPVHKKWLEWIDESIFFFHRNDVWLLWL